MLFCFLVCCCCFGFIILFLDLLFFFQFCYFVMHFSALSFFLDFHAILFIQADENSGRDSACNR